MRVAQVLRAERDEILRRFVDAVRASTREAGGIEQVHLFNSLPRFFDAVVSQLDKVGSKQPASQPDTGEADAVAAEHGEQRHDLGFDIVAVAREWAILRDVVLELLLERGATLDGEYRYWSRQVTAATSHAIRTFTHAGERGRTQLAAQNVGFLVHDLRIKLATASAALAWWRRTPSVATTAAQVVDDSLGDLRRLLDRELSTSRLESARAGLTVRRERLAIAELLAWAIQDAQAPSALREVSLATESEAGLIVEADQRLARSALGNLVATVVNGARRGSAVRLRAQRRDGRVSIEVSSDAETQRADGNGHSERLRELGLAIARQAVEAHGGELVVSSASAATRYRLVLPA